MDETAYYYCMTPSRSHSKHNIAGRKKVKKRITVAVISNGDGSMKIPLLFVGSARQPRCFEGKTAEDNGLQYNNSAKGLMTAHLFQRWLQQFNADMQEQNRFVLLLLDNASCHRVDEQFSNVYMHMVPPNTTAHLQPQDADVIQPFKSQINKIKNDRIVDKLEELLLRVKEVETENIMQQTESFFDVDVLVAMKWAQQAWENAMSATVSNCWRHTAILDDDYYELVERMDSLHVSPSISHLLL